MIFNIFINGFFVLVNKLLDVLPSVNSGIDWGNNPLATFNDVMFDNLGLIDIIAPMSLVFSMFKILIILMLGKWVFDMVMFVIKKIPIANIK